MQAKRRGLVRDITKQGCGSAFCCFSKEAQLLAVVRASVAGRHSLVTQQALLLGFAQGQKRTALAVLVVLFLYA